MASKVNTKSDSIMKGISIWCSFYRNHPHIFVKDYLGIKLKTFQKILLVCMINYTNFLFCGARGISKSFTTALFCCVKAILFPHSKIVIASKTISQGKGVLLKITQELMPKSANLRNEIKTVSMNNQNIFIEFKNGSIVSVCVASENSRGLRATVLVCDEFVLMDKSTIDTVLKKFLTAPRQVGYETVGEDMQEIYLSSCYFKSHWGWDKVKDFAKNLVDNTKKYFVCSLPYQLSLKEGLLLKTTIEGEMSESTFSQLKWDMEMSALWVGESEDAFFQYEDLVSSRRNQNVLYPQNVYTSIPEKFAKPLPKIPREIRILSADIALMSSKKSKNDATSIFIVQMMPTKNGQYVRNVLYADAFEGKHTKDQAIYIRKLFEDADCDYIVLDTNGVGSGVFDSLVDDLIDNQTGILYEGLSCCNNPEMASRYKGSNPSPQKVIYSIKASSSFNSACAFELRDDIKRGKLRLLESESDFESRMCENKSYRELTESQRLDLKMPHIQVTLLVNELVNLDYVLQGTDVKIKEKSGCRKDRYSSISYCNHICNELERKKKPKRVNVIDFPMIAPSIRGGNR